MDANTKFILWHTISKNALSELEFIKDEHTFFENLIKTTDFEFVEDKKCCDRAEILDTINRSEKCIIFLIDEVNSLINTLEHLFFIERTFDKNEQAYIQKHNLLKRKIEDFTMQYNLIKIQLLDIVKEIKKEEKTRRLINRKDALQPTP